MPKLLGAIEVWRRDCPLQRLTRTHFSFSLRLTVALPKERRINSKGLNGPFPHSRNVYVLLSELHRAGVFDGLDSEASVSKPYDPPARWRGGFFVFGSKLPDSSVVLTFDSYSKSTGGEAANAQVCKTCIRGFNSRPALQIMN